MLLTLVAWTTTAINAQKKIKEGVVTLTIENSTDDNPDLAMLNGSTMSFYFSGRKTRIDINMMAGLMRINSVYDNDNAKENFTLVEMMGMKYFITDINPEDVQNTSSFDLFDNFSEIQYDKSDRLEILGYDCYKTTATDQNGQTMVFYITESIPWPGEAKSGKKALAGFPLRLELDSGLSGGIKTVFVATSIQNEVKKEDFDPPADDAGYQKITMEEYMKLMNSLGN